MDPNNTVSTENTQKEPISESKQPEPDLLTRVSQVKPEEPKNVDATFNVNDIDTITDPQAKEYAQKAYKSLESGYTKKFQALAEDRKTWEAKKAQDESWTQERVQTLLKDPNFVQAAQGVAGQTTTDDYSALSDAEKKRITNAENIAKQVLQQNAQLLIHQQHETNKAKYSNYDSQTMDIIGKDILNRKRDITYEDMWKSYDYEPAIKRAYRLGLNDKNVTNQEKFNSMSTEGVSATQSEPAPIPKKGESAREFFVRQGSENMVKFRSGQLQK